MNSIRNKIIVAMLAGILSIATAINIFLWLYIRQAVVAEFDNGLREKAKAFVAFSEQVNIDYDGTQVSMDVLPANVQATIAEHSNTRPHEIEHIKHDEKTFYKVETSDTSGAREFLVSDNGEYLGPFNEYRFAFEDATFLEFQPSPDAEFYLVSEDDEIVARSPSLEGENITLQSGARNESGAVDCTLPKNKNGRAVVVSFKPRMSRQSDGNDDPLTLVLARSRKSLDHTIQFVGAALAGATILLGMSLIPAVWWAAGRGLRPLIDVANATAVIDETRLDYRFESASMPVELVTITQQLNILLERLRAAFQREQRFTSGAAHELRTPIAELRALAEVGLRDTHNGDASVYFRDALAIADQMENLMVALLALARGQAGQYVLKLSEVNLAMLVAERWAEVDQAAKQNGLEIKFDVPEDAVTQTDHTLLSAILKNLLANAVENTPAGGEIDVRISVDPFSLSIANTNANLDVHELPHIMQPFWRKEMARSDGKHCGVGLSIVAAFASLINAEIVAELPQSDRFCIKLTWKR